MFASFQDDTEPWQRLLAQFTTPTLVAFDSYGSGWAIAVIPAKTVIPVKTGIQQKDTDAFLIIGPSPSTPSHPA
jgi:hypothetical protein